MAEGVMSGPEQKGLRQRVTERVGRRFFGLDTPNRTVTNNPDYQAALPQIESSYDQAQLWHGTGKFQYRDGQVVDVLKGIINHGGLTPQDDPYLYSAAPGVQTISTSRARIYSRLYAGLHTEEGQKITNLVGGINRWVGYYLGTFTVNLHKEYHLTSLKRRREFQQQYKTHAAAKKWRSKVMSRPVPLPKLFSIGSDIQGNYPILIGIKRSLVPIEGTPKSIDRHEKRIGESIPMSEFTHLEVPLDKVEETKRQLQKSGRNSAPVIPLEWGEEYSRTLPLHILLNGK